MLTRFKINGFKSLVDVDVRFGPFTCIAGANGVGKSNLFDAIRFLSALSRVSLLEAAREVRGGSTSAVRDLFHRVGDTYDTEMSFEAEMIIPKQGEDELGQRAVAAHTFLRYSLTLAYQPESGGLEIRREALIHIKKKEAKEHLLFEYSTKWLDSAIDGRRDPPFISTEGDPASGYRILLHLDRGTGRTGTPAPRLARTLPRTVLQATNAAEHRTAVIARQEMQSWRLLQLEPSALREPDDFSASSRLTERGEHLPALLSRLAVADEEKVYTTAANRLSQLIADVRAVGVERDEKRELLTLWAKGEDGTRHAARSLSDGTLRFLALAALEQDPESQGVLCLEEPENGIHPERIPAIIRLLKDIAVDVTLPVGPDNPLRQVIANTHSPSMVAQVEENDLIAAQLQERVRQGRRFKSVAFHALSGTWRATGVADRDLMPRSQLVAYLDPFHKRTSGNSHTRPFNGKGSANGKTPPGLRRVIDRDDLQQILGFENET